MGDLPRTRKNATSIMHLPDDCLAIIFKGLNSRNDRYSFGLTCRQWLHIQNLNHRSLHFKHSSTVSSSSKDSCNPTFQLLKLLRRFQHLKCLSLSNCTEFIDSGLTSLVYYGSNLRILNLYNCSQVTNYGLSLVASGCPSLITIDLYSCHYVNDEGIKTLTQQCRQLEAIGISNCKDISGVGFEGCSNTLACVEARFCKLKPEGVMGIVSGGGIEYLNLSFLHWSVLVDPFLGIGFSSRLKILNFRNCRTVSDTSVVAIAKGCPLLEEWNLVFCQEVRVSGWQAIGLYCQNLKTLHINYCCGLCDMSWKALQEGCISLSILYSSISLLLKFGFKLFWSHRPNVCIKIEEVIFPKPYLHIGLNELNVYSFN